MKKEQLKKIIKEQIQLALKEDTGPDAWDGYSDDRPFLVLAGVNHEGLVALFYETAQEALDAANPEQSDYDYFEGVYYVKKLG